MTNPRDPLDSFTTDPATGRNAYWLQGIAYEMMRHDLIQHLVDLVRDEFDLTNPLDEDDLALNRHIPRATVRTRVREIAADTLWTEDLEFLNLLFHPEKTLAESADQLSQSLSSELLDTVTLLTGDPEALNLLFHPEETLAESADQPSQSLSSELLDAITPLIPQITNLLRDSGLLDTFPDLAVDMLTDHVIEGELSLPRPLPSWFAHNILAFPLEGDRLIVALVTRFTDIEQVIDDLRAKHAQLFVPGDRATHPHNAKRDTWLIIQYHNIKDARTTDDDTFYDDLPKDPGKSSRPTIYDQLLIRFEASPWKDDLAPHDLDTPEGQTGAKDFLRNIVRTQRQRFQRIMNSVDHPPGDPV